MREWAEHRMVSSLYILNFVMRHSGKLAFVMSLLENWRNLFLRTPNAFERKHLLDVITVNHVGCKRESQAIRMGEGMRNDQSTFVGKALSVCIVQFFTGFLKSGEQFSNLFSELRIISEYHWRSEKNSQIRYYSIFFKKEKKNGKNLAEKFFVFISVFRALYLSLTNL